MFGNAIVKLPQNYGILKTICPAITAVRHGHRLRGKPFGVAKTIERRLQCELKCFEVMFNFSKLSIFRLYYLDFFLENH